MSFGDPSRASLVRPSTSAIGGPSSKASSCRGLDYARVFRGTRMCDGLMWSTSAAGTRRKNWVRPKQEGFPLDNPAGLSSSPAGSGLPGEIVCAQGGAGRRHAPRPHPMGSCWANSAGKGETRPWLTPEALSGARQVRPSGYSRPGAPCPLLQKRARSFCLYPIQR